MTLCVEVGQRIGNNLCIVWKLVTRAPQALVQTQFHLAMVLEGRLSVFFVHKSQVALLLITLQNLARQRVGKVDRSAFLDMRRHRDDPDPSSMRTACSQPGGCD
jgi:hypothetical protein